MGRREYIHLSEGNKYTGKMEWSFELFKYSKGRGHSIKKIMPTLLDHLEQKNRRKIWKGGFATWDIHKIFYSGYYNSNVVFAFGIDNTNHSCHSFFVLGVCVVHFLHYINLLLINSTLWWFHFFFPQWMYKQNCKFHAPCFCKAASWWLYQLDRSPP